MQTKKSILGSKIIAVGLFLMSIPGLAQTWPSAQQPDDKSVRPFHIQIPDSALTDLRQRIKVIRWPGKETVTKGY